MTYHPPYYSCDVCQRTLDTCGFGEIKPGKMHFDGDGKHICNDCSIKRGSERVLQAGLRALSARRAAR